MQFIQFALALSPAILVAADCTATSAIPTCGVACITSAASAVGCVYNDYACQCSSSQSTAIQSAALGCVIQSCGIPTALQVQSAAQAVCTACA